MDAATLVLEPLKRASTSSSRHTDDGSSPADAVAVDGSRCVLGRAGGDSVVAGVTTLNVSRCCIVNVTKELCVFNGTVKEPSGRVSLETVENYREGNLTADPDGDAPGLRPAMSSFGGAASSRNSVATAASTKTPMKTPRPSGSHRICRVRLIMMVPDGLLRHLQV